MGETLRAMIVCGARWGKRRAAAQWRGIYTGASLVLGIAALGLLPGCDSTSFVPPRPSELSRSPAPGMAKSSGGPSSPARSATASPVAATGTGTPRTAPASRARLVELILSRPADADRLYMAQFLRRDAALKKCALRVVSPENNVPMSPEQLASAIRTAANRSTGAVILEPIDAPEVRDALREAEAKALPIVLLDAPLPSSSPGKPYPYVTYRGFVDAGKKLVEVLADDARLLRLPPDGTTLVIENRDKDLYSRQRLESITSALKTASRAYEVVSFEGGLKGAFEIVTEYLKAHPKVTMILADHEFGVAGAYDARAQWKESGKHEVILGGYAACDVRLDQIVKALAEGLANRNVEGYARKAFQVAIDLMDGKPAPERAEVEIRVIHNPPQYQPVSDETKELIPPGGPAPARREPAQPPSSSSEPREKP